MHFWNLSLNENYLLFTFVVNIVNNLNFVFVFAEAVQLHNERERCRLVNAMKLVNFTVEMPLFPSVSREYL